MADEPGREEPVGEVEPRGRVIGRGPARMKGIRSGLWGEAAAEFLGTFVLIAFGDGVVATAVVGLGGSGRAAFIPGGWVLITLGWAFAVAFGIYVAGGVTGAHINPAVTLAMAVRGGFPWVKVIPYWVAQVVGAFLGAGLVYAVYGWAINAFLTSNHLVQSANVATYSIFATFPAPYFGSNWWGPLIDQVVGTAFLLMFVAALTDRRNLLPKANMAPFMVGIAVAAIGLSFGTNAGYAINPARDFGPRVWAYITGWGQIAMPGNYPGGINWYFWIPIVGPLVGGVIGIVVYEIFIKDVLVAREVPEQSPD
ncbi:MAG: aquaporin family protein [Candidatus Dormibacteraeota bacterium]|nr:aquaporin family protein [Candidatus Dormibacteraeota bacterium]MBO0704611.1 aquaporin family protein [Candidatus Dormibacteraeota bacterium]MBO0760181.1 aquaporin family protein [Candidatus Dormibacteraeota bacterium]